MILLNKHKDKIPADAVYIGRGSALGNPYVIGKHGTREEVISMYRGWLTKKIEQKDPEVKQALSNLHAESKLVCFCHPVPCHGAVIDELWRANYGEPAMGMDKNGYIGYKEWLLRRLFSQHPSTCVAFRDRAYTKDTVLEGVDPAEQSKIFMELYDEIFRYESFDQGVAAVAKEQLGLVRYLPVTDGLDHINIYSQGKTKLGKFLSNFARSPFIHPVLGKFDSVEGFWYYAKTGFKHEQLKKLSGFEAKKVGKTFETVVIPNHQALVKQAIICKVYQDRGLMRAIRSSVLPFTHYYVYGSDTNPVVREKEDDKWLAEFFEKIRRDLNRQEKDFKVIIAGSRSLKTPDCVKLVTQAYDDSGFNATEIVCGEAAGPDRIGRDHVAKPRGISVKSFPAKWDELGKRAGIVRNHEMGDYADAAVIVWDTRSNGSKDMLDYMLNQFKPVWLEQFPF